MFGSRLSPIGLDIGGRCVKAVQLARSGGKWRVSAAAMIERRRPGQPIGAEELAPLGQVLYRRGMEGSRVVLAATKAELVTETLELPPRDSGAPLEQIACAEMARAARVEPEALELALWDLPAPLRGSGQTYAMAVAIPTPRADEWVDLLAAQGFTAVALDCPAGALFRACLPLAGQGISAALDLGWEFPLLALMDQNAVLYQRLLPEFSCQAICRAIGEPLGIEPVTASRLWQAEDWPDRPGLTLAMQRWAEALRRELDASVAYASHRYPDRKVERLLASGGGAALPGMMEILGAAMPLPVKPVRVSEMIECPKPLLERCGCPTMATALGLALHPER